MTNNQRRNGDKWWIKTILGLTVVLVNASVVLTVYVFTTFPTKTWAIDKHEIIVSKITEKMQHQKEINDLKLDFIKDSIGKSNKEIEMNRRKLEKTLKQKRKEK